MKTQIINNYEDKYNLDNPIDRADILEFEKRYGIKNLEEILRDNNCYRVSDNYPNGVINLNRIEIVEDLRQKYKALTKLHKRRYFIEEREEERIKELYTTQKSHRDAFHLEMGRE